MATESEGESQWAAWITRSERWRENQVSNNVEE